MNSRQSTLLVLVALIFFGWPIAEKAAAQTFGSDSHNVTVQVAQVTRLSVSTGTVDLTISDVNAVAGEDMMTVTDQNSRLLWGTNSSGRKITASTSLAAPLFQLALVAVSPTAGTAAPEMILSTVPRDLLLNIGRTSGSCFLRYTGTAFASQGVGTDAHSITFTVQSQ